MSTVSEDTRFAIYRVAVRELLSLLETCEHRAIYEAITTSRFAIMPDGFEATQHTSAEIEASATLMLSWDSIVELRHPERDYPYILRAIDAVVVRYPKNVWLRAFRARALFAIDHFSAAMKDLEYALTLDPYHAIAISLKGDVHYLMGEYQLALEALSFCILRYPRYYRGYVTRALTYNALARDAKSTDYKRLYYSYALRDLAQAEATKAQGLDNTILHTLKNQISSFYYAL